MKGGIYVHIETPECDKLRKVTHKSQIIGEFLAWLQDEKGLVICDLEDNEYLPYGSSINQMLADYFEINLDKVEREKQAILDGIRIANEVRDEAR